jgi:hypothetical protein
MMAALRLSMAAFFWGRTGCEALSKHPHPMQDSQADAMMVRRLQSSRLRCPTHLSSLRFLPLGVSRLGFDLSLEYAKVTGNPD